MKKRLRTLLLSVGGLLVVAVCLTFTPVLVHVRNYVSRGEVGILDFSKHPTRTVKAAPIPQPWPLDSVYNGGSVPKALLDSMEKVRTTAFLVFQDGKLLYEKYWEKFDAKTRSQSFSAVKSVVSMLVGIAVGEGKIKSIDQPVSDYLPAFADGEKAKITLRNCLTMSTGLDWHEKDRAPFSNNAYGYYGEDLEKVINDLHVEKPAGKEFEYRSGDTEILGLVLEKVYGKNLSELLSEKIFQPIGAETDALWMLDKENGREKAYCCLAPTARDYARFGHLMLDKGNWKGRQIVPKSYMEEALSPARYLGDPKNDNKPLEVYGFQYWIQPYDTLQIPTMRGLLGQLVYAIPSKNAVVVRLGHQESPNKRTPYFREDSYWYLDAAMKVLR